MKTFKQLLWFIIPTVVIWIWFYILTFTDTSNYPKFMSNQNYLKLFLQNTVFLRALMNTCIIPLVMSILVGMVLFLVKHLLLKGKYHLPFCGITFIISTMIFHFTANLRLFMGLPPSAYSSHSLVSASSLVTQINIPAMLISMQIGIVVSCLFWCGDKIVGKIKKAV